MDSRMRHNCILLITLLVALIIGVICFVNKRQIERRFFPDRGNTTMESGENTGKDTSNESGNNSKIKDIQQEAADRQAAIDEAGASFQYFPDGFAGADPSKQVGEGLHAFLSDETFFDPKLSDAEKRMLEGSDDSLCFVITSVEKDMRIQIQSASGKVITGVPFEIHLKDTGDYVDRDKDGLVYISNLAAGNYEVSLEEVEGYKVPQSMIVSVRDKVSYTAIDDISLLIKTEDDIIAEVEDTEKRDALDEKDSSEVKDIRELGESGQMGIDVSKWNGEIDWNQVRDAGINFAIIRAGYRGSSTGALVEDPYFKQNMRGAMNAGIKVGVYFFTQATTEVEAVEEASMVMSLCSGYHITYPIFIDTEGAGGNGRADGLDILTRTAMCKAFCETIESGNYTAGVYASKNWLLNRLYLADLEDYMTWLAEYREEPSYMSTYQLWQYTSSGNVPGISGRVDLDVSYLTY